MSDPAMTAANRAMARHWKIVTPSSAKPMLPVINAAAREALAPIREKVEALRIAAQSEDAEVEHGMHMVLEEIAPLVYGSEDPQ